MFYLFAKIRLFLHIVRFDSNVTLNHIGTYLEVVHRIKLPWLPEASLLAVRLALA